ncbi:ComF family protein [Leucobacter sp. USHLN153]|uniref:ComF family protein n=1 Tax=Leucobacter sp. USHLN153 TaxID=3081268 RepID=UPI00301A3C94
MRGTYAGPLRALLVAFKHEGRFGFRGVLGDALRSPLLDALALAAVSSRSEPPLLVAMPSRPSSVRKRGYRHLEVLIAKALPRGMPRPRVVRALRTTRGRVGQVGLSSSERERNAGRIAVSRRFRRSVRGRGIVLVDDIVTTGASVRRAILSLETAGGKVVAIAALSAAERRDSPGESANSIQTGRGGGIAAEGWSRVPGKA